MPRCAHGVVPYRTVVATDARPRGPRVDCPTCGAAAETPCVGPEGDELRTAHPDRMEAARAVARAVACPLCNAEAGAKCVDDKGRDRDACHAERWAVVRPGQWTAPERKPAKRASDSLAWRAGYAAGINGQPQHPGDHDLDDYGRGFRFARRKLRMAPK